MTRIVLSFISLGLVLGATSSAHAIANHKIEAVQKIVKKGKLWGARVHLLVDPENYKQYRINIAPQDKVPPALRANDMTHRHALANASGKFVLKTAKTARDISGLQEVYVDIKYGKALQPGKAVNVLSAFTNGQLGFVKASTDHMHIYGAWDGPLTQNDKANIITLPENKAEIPNATKTLAVPAAAPAADPFTPPVNTPSVPGTSP